MTGNSRTQQDSIPFRTRLYRVVVSIVVLTGVTVVAGFAGWILLSISAQLVGYDPKTVDGDLLRHRLAEWPDRNRAVMRTNGREPLPWKP